MPTIKELHQVYLAQLNTILKESDLLLQKQEGGLDGELKSSGWICEQFIRRTLQKFIVPGHLRLATGFIATPQLLSGQANLPQCDILIVAGNVPPLLRLEDTGIEVVPAEAVCGILEVKRTLNTKSIQHQNGALRHLAEVVESIGRTQTLKTDKKLNMANLAVGYHNASSDKPLLGIIALKNEIEDMQLLRSAINDSDSLVDFVWTLDGHAFFPGVQNPGEDNFWWYTHTARPETRTWEKLTVADFQSSESPFYRQLKGRPRWYYLGRPSTQQDRQDLFDSAQVFARVIGILAAMLSRICVRPLAEEQINDYFLRAP
jgi:hypothetical protein